MRAEVGSWFDGHPEAVEAVRLWLVELRDGKTRRGLRAMVTYLAEEHQYPFRGHNALLNWVQRCFPDLYAVSVKRTSVAGTVAASFKRSRQDLKRLERREDFFVTCAVQESYANRGFLKAALHWCEERNGALLVNPVYYVNPRTRTEAEQRSGEKWWDPALREYMLDNEIRPHDGLSIMTTKAQATAHNPLPARLSGRTKARSAVFGHPQMTMRTVATPQSRLPKILYASGAITEKNYSDTLSGDMGEFHHTLGGVLVEVRGDRFYLTEVVWDGHGFTDRDRYYTAEGSGPAPPPAALVMGDIHAPHFVAPNVMEATFGKGGIVPVLKPRRLFLHDLADNRNANPHELPNKLTRAALAGRGEASIEEELRGVVEWVHRLPAFEEIVVVRSNHDDFLERWLQRANPEPQNAKLFHKLSYLMLEYYERHGDFPIPLELALREGISAKLPESLRFLDHDESYQLGGIELGMHGHLGPNGARGSMRNLSMIGTRSMIGHVHGPGIWQGVHAVGLSAVYRHHYNRGPSSWLQTNGLVHASGYRQLIHIIDSCWRG